MNAVLHRIESLCDKRDISIATLCREVDGLKHSTYSSWKKNDRIPKPEVLSDIAEYFDVSVDYLLTGDEQSEDEDKIYMNDVLQALYHSVNDGTARFPSGKLCDDEQTRELLKTSIGLVMNTVTSLDK